MRWGDRIVRRWIAKINTTRTNTKAHTVRLTLNTATTQDVYRVGRKEIAFN